MTLAPTSLLAPIEADTLALSPRLDPSQMLTVFNRVKFYEAEAKRIRKLCEQMFIEWITENGDLEAGNGIRYYVGADKKTKCVDVAATVESLLASVDGDFKRFCEHLASDAIKHGAARKTLPPADYDRLFKTEITPSLEEGKSKLKLMTANANFK